MKSSFPLTGSWGWSSTDDLRSVMLETCHPETPHLDGLSGLFDNDADLRPVWTPTDGGVIHMGDGRSILTDQAHEIASMLSAWHRYSLRRAALYWFSEELIEHAWRCEQAFPELVLDAGSLVSQHGLLVLETPIGFRSPTEGGWQPLRAVAWGPVDQCGFEPVSYARGDDGQRRARPVSGMGRPVHLRMLFEHGGRMPPGWAWPVYERSDYVADLDGGVVVGDEAALGDIAVVLRLVVIGFLFAQHRQAGESQERAVAPPRKRRAREGGVKQPGAPVRAMGLRRHVAANLRRSGMLVGETTSRVRDPYRYVKVCWPVTAVVDPDTGDIKKKSTVAFRDPSLLAEFPGDVVRVGTLGSRSER